MAKGKTMNEAEEEVDRAEMVDAISPAPEPPSPAPSDEVRCVKSGCGHSEPLDEIGRCQVLVFIPDGPTTGDYQSCDCKCEFPVRPPPSIVPWKCACGWRGTAGEMNDGPGGIRVCPNCGASGGLILDDDQPVPASATTESIEGGQAASPGDGHFEALKQAMNSRARELHKEPGGFVSQLAAVAAQYVREQLATSADEPKALLADEVFASLRESNRKDYEHALAVLRRLANPASRETVSDGELVDALFEFVSRCDIANPIVPLSSHMLERVMFLAGIEETPRGLRRSYFQEPEAQ